METLFLLIIITIVSITIHKNFLLCVLFLFLHFLFLFFLFLFFLFFLFFWFFFLLLFLIFLFLNNNKLAISRVMNTFLTLFNCISLYISYPHVSVYTIFVVRNLAK